MIKFNQNTRLKKQIDVNKDQRKKVKKKKILKNPFLSRLWKRWKIYMRLYGYRQFHCVHENISLCAGDAETKIYTSNYKLT